MNHPASPHEHAMAGAGDVEQHVDSETGSEPHVPTATTPIDHVLEAVAAMLLAVIVSLLFVNAALRFTINSPLGWTEEIVTGLMLWLTMIGFVIGVRRNDSISVRAFVGRLPLKTQVWVKLLTDLVSAAALLHLAWFGYQYVVTFGGDATPYLQLPQAFFTAALPVGAVLAAAALLVQLRGNRAVIQRWDDELSPSSPAAEVAEGDAK